ncbi:MAG: methylated-DNA--[protein]-cysteine S-methyltransferase [Desulfobulbaceae bacterium]|jgi:methylated-DNA-[protein]-cysteine S-methyltransferase|nr:methylated-DNA--[protein]-cysteine S-methyltransferase [Desulfobulbaceae bacterium]
MPLNTCSFSSDFGEIHIFAQDGALCLLRLPGQETTAGQFFDDATRNFLDDRKDPLLREARAQLTAYFGGDLRRFDLPIAPVGTAFQKEVWRALMAIPYGETATYGAVAQGLGDKNKARAVGGAAHVNPIPLVIPCHRLIGSDGGLTGFACGLAMKKALLALERRHDPSPAA